MPDEIDIERDDQRSLGRDLPRELERAASAFSSVRTSLGPQRIKEGAPTVPFDTLLELPRTDVSSGPARSEPAERIEGAGELAQTTSGDRDVGRPGVWARIRRQEVQNAAQTLASITETPEGDADATKLTREKKAWCLSGATARVV